jgi:hypothetical protein
VPGSWGSCATVRRYLRAGQREAYQRAHPAQELLERDHGDYLRQRGPLVDWSAQLLFQEIVAREYGGSYESIKRWVRPLREQRRRLEAAVRFETGPGAGTGGLGRHDDRDRRAVGPGSRVRDDLHSPDLRAPPGRAVGFWSMPMREFCHLGGGPRDPL